MNMTSLKSDEKEQNPSTRLRKKVHTPRASLLTELFQNNHIATIYHLSLTLFLAFMVNSAIQSWVYGVSPNYGFRIIFKSFNKLHYAAFIWLGMFLASFLCYYGFKLWVVVRIALPRNSLTTSIWDKTMILATVAFYCAFLYFPPYILITLELSIALTLALLCDTMRFMMVFHSFIRTNAEKVVRYDENDKVKPSYLCPSLGKFIYFSFAPTLLYQDEYHRSPNRSWSYILTCVAEFLISIIFMAYTLDVYMVESLQNYCLKDYSVKDLTIILFKNYICGLVFAFTTFYVILHVWCNGFAELLRFSDRHFYSDWWTSTSYVRYYKTWNVVVHDWLYTFVYKDFYEHVYSGSTIPARMLVFLISAIFHEYVLALSFRFLMPIMFIEFVFIGVPIMFLSVKSKLFGNTFFLYSLGLGTGFIMTAYAMEYYARNNCPVDNSTLYNYLIPQMFSCSSRCPTIH